MCCCINKTLPYFHFLVRKLYLYISLIIIHTSYSYGRRVFLKHALKKGYTNFVKKYVAGRRKH